MAHDIRDGGVRTLRTAHHIEGDARVTDLTTGRVIDPDLYHVQAESVRKARGVWARGHGRWLIEYTRAEHAAQIDLVKPDAS